jgi:hypothetical protein
LNFGIDEFGDLVFEDCSPEYGDFVIVEAVVLFEPQYELGGGGLQGFGDGAGDAEGDEVIESDGGEAFNDVDGESTSIEVSRAAPVSSPSPMAARASASMKSPPGWKTEKKRVVPSPFRL